MVEYPTERFMVQNRSIIKSTICGSLKHIEFIKKYVICMMKYVLVKKCLQMCVTGVCHNKPDSKKVSIELKHTVSLLKDIFWMN